MEAIGIIKHIGMTFALIGSTFGMVFYYAAWWDGKIDESERHFMHIVYFVVRIGLYILIPWEIGVMFWTMYADIPSYYESAVNWFRVFLLGIIFYNAVLMKRHKMPLWIGPAIAGGSWYYYFFVSVTHKTFGVAQLFLYYVIFVGLLACAMHILKKVLIDKRNRI